MLQVYSFVFSPMEENSYVLYDETGECILLDPGCYDARERNEFFAFIEAKNLRPVRLINTHTHLDHILGNYFVSEKYKLFPEYHILEDPLIRYASVFAENFGLDYSPSPLAKTYLKENEMLRFGNTELEILFTPGHSPGSLSFFNKNQGILLSGDVLFKGSIGRTDLPYGNTEQLMETLKQLVRILPEETRVFSGHGLSTTLKHELETNPYLAL